ncbi:orotate phosphoribosyltransferase [Chloroflexota bacterium]
MKHISPGEYNGGVGTVRAQRIRDLAIELGAFGESKVTLSSGARSGRYFDGKKVTLSPEGAYEVGKAVFEEIAPFAVDAVGGPTIGADPIAAAVSLVSHLEGSPLPAFIVREQAKEHGLQQQVYGHLPPGASVAIVDDVITSGGSILRAIDAVEALGCRVAVVVALVDRHEGGSDRLRRMGYQFRAFLGYREAGVVEIE